MKITVKIPQHKFALFIPNSFFLSAPAVHIANACGRHIDSASIPHIDPASAAVLRKEIKRLKKQGRTLSIVEVETHSGEYVSVHL